MIFIYIYYVDLSGYLSLFSAGLVFNQNMILAQKMVGQIERKIDK